MEVKILPLSRWKGTDQSLVLFAAEGQNHPMGWSSGEAALKRLMTQAKEEGFTGKALQVVLLHPEGAEPARRVYLAGVGSLQGLNEDSFRQAAGQASRTAASTSARGLTVRFPERGDAAKVRRYARAITEGVILAQYRFTEWRNSPLENDGKPLEHLVILHGDEARSADIDAGVRLGTTVAGAVNYARDLVNEPPSNMTPMKLAERARKLGPKIKVRVMDLKSIERLGMGGVAGVGRGSHNPPVFIHLHYQGSKARAKVALVGKGVTFDAGGLSLKTSEQMETMKMDMAGAAAVMAVMYGVDKLKLPLAIEGYIPAVENMPGGGAIKPGDVLKTYTGKTVEVLNTDAEGRLILADVLAYAAKEKPDSLIDIATLTGACVVALGSRVTGIMGTDQELVTALISAGTTAGEPIWQLPLVKEYREQMKSKVADLKNIGGKREAGAIIGGLFLREFVGNASWAHLDIAGTAWAEKDLPVCPAGATGTPVRAMLNFLLKAAQAPES